MTIFIGQWKIGCSLALKLEVVPADIPTQTGEVLILIRLVLPWTCLMVCHQGNTTAGPVLVDCR